MSGKIASIIGSTGMIGQHLLQQLLAGNYFDEVRTLVRRPSAKMSGRHSVKLVDFSDMESLKLALDGSHTIFSCIGTTQKNVKGDNNLYRKIDFEIPVHAAKLGKETGCENFIIVTAVGANSNSKQFYIRLKGEVEDALAGLNIRTVHVFQPSMLLGKREESRSLERVLQGSFKVIDRLFFGSWRKFRAVEGSTVATAMINAAEKEVPGFFRHTYDDIIGLAALSQGKHA